MNHIMDKLESSNGEIRAWIEQGASVCLIAKDSHGDPVELNKDEFLDLISKLERLAEMLEDR